MDKSFLNEQDEYYDNPFKLYFQWRKYFYREHCKVEKKECNTNLVGEWQLKDYLSSRKFLHNGETLSFFKNKYSGIKYDVEILKRFRKDVIEPDYKKIFPKSCHSCIEDYLNNTSTD